MRFTKMQGTGNDFLFVDCTERMIPDPSALAARVCDRHFGVGGDGLILILPGERADFRMAVYNADGGEAPMCGNAARCLAKYVYERGLTAKRELTLETASGLRRLYLNTEEGRVTSVRVDMGAPEFRPERVPVVFPGVSAGQDGPAKMVPLEVEGRVFRVTCVSMGNPHCVVFQDEVEDWPLAYWGPRFEHAPVFPEKTNTEFARVESRGVIRMRVWERGCGETMACGTGACAVLAAAAVNGLADRSAVIRLNGGELEVAWDEKTGHLFMTGPAAFVFDGELP